MHEPNVTLNLTCSLPDSKPDSNAYPTVCIGLCQACLLWDSREVHGGAEETYGQEETGPLQESSPILEGAVSDFHMGPIFPLRDATVPVDTV